MHNRKVFVLKDLNYAASKTSTTLNTALNPQDLRDGAVGIYGIHRTGATNLDKLVLIADGGAEAAGVVPAASFVGDQVFIAFGVASGSNQISGPIDKPTGLQAATGKKYTAPVLGAFRVGYNGTAGTSFNLPATVLAGDDFTIKVLDRNSIVSGFRSPYIAKNLSISAALNDTAYVLAKKWVAALNLRQDDIMIDKLKVKILHNGTGAVFTTSATVAGVNGATTLTTSAAHGVTAGDAISLAGDYYLTVTGTTGSTLVLDRPFQGATGTIANADTLDITGAATAWGIEMVDDQVGRNLDIASSGLLVNAIHKTQTYPLAGNGTQAQIQAIEEEARPKKGTTDMLTTYIDRDPIRSVTTYDQYILTVHNRQHAKGAQGSVFLVLAYLTLAFPSGVADTAGFAQSDFEDAMTSLFTTFPAISA